MLKKKEVAVRGLEQLDQRCGQFHSVSGIRVTFTLEFNPDTRNPTAAVGKKLGIQALNRASVWFKGKSILDSLGVTAI